MDINDLLPPIDDGDLTPTEIRLVECASTGNWWYPNSERSSGDCEDPCSAESWPDTYKIRSHIIVALLTGATRTSTGRPFPIHPHGIQIANALIVGELDFRGCNLVAAFTLLSCGVPERISFVNARTQTVTLDGCCIASLCAERATVLGDFLLRYGFKSRGEISLSHAEIHGNLSFKDSMLNNENGSAVDAAKANIGGNVVLRGQFHSVGCVNFNSARIGGQLSCDGGRFENPKGVALNVGAAVIGSDVFMGDGFRAAGEVLLYRVTIGGQFRCGGGTFENAGDLALNARGAQITSDVLLNDGFSANGCVVLAYANISGALNCKEGNFNSPDGTALACYGVNVCGDVLLCLGFHAVGLVHFLTAKVGGRLFCFGGVFENPNDIALNFCVARIGLDVSAGNGMKAAGGVVFYRAEIGGGFSCTGGTFEKPSNVSIDGNGLPPPWPPQTALTLGHAKVGGELNLSGVKAMVGDLDLSQAEARSLNFDASEFQKSGHTYLDGFTYQHISGVCGNWKSWLKWLRRQPPDHLGREFKPHPWTQLINVLHKMGHEEASRCIAVERAKAMSRRPQVSWLERRWLQFLGCTVGYGYRPWRAMLWSIVFVVAGSITFYFAERTGYMAPRDGSVITHMEQYRRPNPPHEYTRFHPFVYAADVYLPVVELGQDAAWVPSYPENSEKREAILIKRIGENCTFDKVRRFGVSSCLDSIGLTAAQIPMSGGTILFEMGLHRAVYWFEELLGWIFISLFVAGMSGVMKKE
jgi:hypothetical protein